MKTNNLLKTGLLLFIPLFLLSCIDNEVNLTGQGDAYVLLEVNGQDTVMGLGLHAFSFADFKSVTVTVTGKPTLSYTLKSYLNYQQDFVWESPLSQFTKTLPATGEYVFNAVFSDGKTLMFNDILTADIIAPPKIKSCAWVKQNARIEVQWDKVQRADVYNVKLLDQSGNILFVSPAFNNAVSSYYFASDTQGWQSTTTMPAEGQTLKVEVTAYLLEARNDENNLQCIAKSRSEIIWGK
jgi:hypothetical protein